MPRVNDRRVAHKSTGGIPPKIPTPVGSVGNAPNHLTPNTVALSASESAMLSHYPQNSTESPRVRRLVVSKSTRDISTLEIPTPFAWILSIS